MHQINLYVNSDSKVNTAYLAIIGKLYKLTPQQENALGSMISIDPLNPAANRAQAAKDAKIKTQANFNNIFNVLKQKGIIIPGDTTKYAYAPGVVLPLDVKEIKINFIEYAVSEHTVDAGREEKNN